VSQEPGAVRLVAPVTPALGGRGRCAALSYGCAPARPRCGRGFSRRPAALAKTAGVCRPPAGLFRPHRSVPQVADEADSPRLLTRPRRHQGERLRPPLANLTVRQSRRAMAPAAPCGGEGLRPDQARRGPATDGRPFSLSQEGELKTPGRSPPRWGRSHKTKPRSGLRLPRVDAAGAAGAMARRLSPPRPRSPHRQKKAAQCAASKASGLGVADQVYPFT
jgi:hypothetical protein